MASVAPIVKEEGEVPTPTPVPTTSTYMSTEGKAKEEEEEEDNEDEVLISLSPASHTSFFTLYSSPLHLFFLLTYLPLSSYDALSLIMFSRQGLVGQGDGQVQKREAWWFVHWALGVSHAADSRTSGGERKFGENLDEFKHHGGAIFQFCRRFRSDPQLQRRPPQHSPRVHDMPMGTGTVTVTTGFMLIMCLTDTANSTEARGCRVSREECQGGLV